MDLNENMFKTTRVLNMEKYRHKTRMFYPENQPDFKPVKEKDLLL